ncbi:MAG: hypothetical protein MHMPM18_000031 [Marteilia pararefringens]
MNLMKVLLIVILSSFTLVQAVKHSLSIVKLERIDSKYSITRIFPSRILRNINNNWNFMECIYVSEKENRSTENNQISDIDDSLGQVPKCLIVKLSNIEKLNINSMLSNFDGRSVVFTCNDSQGITDNSQSQIHTNLLENFPREFIIDNKSSMCNFLEHFDASIANQTIIFIDIISLREFCILVVLSCFVAILIIVVLSLLIVPIFKNICGRLVLSCIIRKSITYTTYNKFVAKSRHQNLDELTDVIYRPDESGSFANNNCPICILGYRPTDEIIVLRCQHCNILLFISIQILDFDLIYWLDRYHSR